MGAIVAAATLAGGCSPTAPQDSRSGSATPAMTDPAPTGEPVATRNKAIVRDAFAGWANGTGNVFDLLTEDVVWTISGSEPGAGVFRGKQDFLTRAVKPLADRLATPVKPVVQGLYADGDTVVVRFDATATARSGRPYANSYVWLLTMRDGRIAAGTAFLDMRAYNDVVLGPDRPGR